MPNQHQFIWSINVITCQVNCGTPQSNVTHSRWQECQSQSGWTHWCRNKMARTKWPIFLASILQRRQFSCAFSWKKSFVFWFEFHWSLLQWVHFTIGQHWFWLWLGAKQAPSHYLNQCSPCSMTPYGIMRPQWNDVTHSRWNICQSHPGLAQVWPTILLGLRSITPSLHGNFNVHHIYKFIKWFSDNYVTNHNKTLTEVFVIP